MPKPSKVEIQHISPQGHSTECTHCTNVYKCPKCTIHCQTRIVTIITTNTDNVCGSCWVRELTEARSAKVGFGGSGGWRGEFGSIWRISIFTPLVGWSLSGTRHSWSVHPGPGWQNACIRLQRLFRRGCRDGLTRLHRLHIDDYTAYSLTWSA